MMATPEEGDDDLFGDQLATPTTSLGLPPPEFRGKQLPPTAPGDHRWIIEGNVRGRLVRTETHDIVFYKMSPNWEIGVEMAMHWPALCNLPTGDVSGFFFLCLWEAL